MNHAFLQSPLKQASAALQVPPLDRSPVAAAAVRRAGLVERVAFDGQARLRVMPARDADSNDLMRRWRDMAVEAWLTSGHPGWAIATEPMVGSSGVEMGGVEMGSEAWLTSGRHGWAIDRDHGRSYGVEMG